MNGPDKPKTSESLGAQSLDARSLGAAIYVADLERVTRFYTQVFGLEVEDRQSGFAVLNTSGWRLYLVAMPPEVVAEFGPSDPPERREDTALKLIFGVSDLAGTRERVAANGGTLNAPDGEWVMGADRVCDGHDCEGNVFQVRTPT
jgi:predicted enzyme related to lactoylglutathione lyase